MVNSEDRQTTKGESKYINYERVGMKWYEKRGI